MILDLGRTQLVAIPNIDEIYRRHTQRVEMKYQVTTRQTALAIKRTFSEANMATKICAATPLPTAINPLTADMVPYSELREHKVWVKLCRFNSETIQASNAVKSIVVLTAPIALPNIRIPIFPESMVRFEIT